MENLGNRQSRLDAGDRRPGNAGPAARVIVSRVRSQANRCADPDNSRKAPNGGRYRRMSKDYEHRVQTSETLIDLIAIRLMLNRLTKS
jgi:hypothetical protein